MDRICPGRHFGLAAVYINVASALHVFDFSPPVDVHGREIRIEPRMPGTDEPKTLGVQSSRVPSAPSSFEVPGDLDA
ncbi:hypothetical protein BD309DRAFT_1015532 [Dichomitus squalens]|uniref:Uncharacterized protein n=1 Tax=Dichomitus squalens TaxID=114155 RepID=A0A4Q9P3D7_9APHY|nr:hypothetical protein BD309DRAFT_1015532 [Dichomitus squalens]TBU59004.1 hypothetical protein BD310DRAFT_877846 [Dichomitus squalens]